MWGLSKVILEADSVVAVHLICHDVNNLQPLGSIILGCQEIMNEVWDCKIITYRERNMVVDWMADLGSKAELGLSLFQAPTPSVRSFLFEDMIGVCRPQAIVSLVFRIFELLFTDLVAPLSHTKKKKKPCNLVELEIRVEG